MKSERVMKGSDNRAIAINFSRIMGWNTFLSRTLRMGYEIAVSRVVNFVEFTKEDALIKIKGKLTKINE